MLSKKILSGVCEDPFASWETSSHRLRWTGMPTHPSRLALDTHIWIWYVNGSEIKPKIREIIYQALQHGTVLVPSICVWEIGMLWRNNRIQLAQPVREWIHDALDKTGF